MNIQKLRQLLEEEKEYKNGFKKSGLIIEKILQKVYPHWEKLSTEHPSGFDFKYGNKYIDIKCGEQSLNNGSDFLEYNQSSYSGISNHWKVEMLPNMEYFLLYFDTNDLVNERPVTIHLWDWKKLKEIVKDWGHNIPGGYEARGDIVNPLGFKGLDTVAVTKIPYSTLTKAAEGLLFL